MTPEIESLDLLHDSWSRCWRGLGASGEGTELRDRLIVSYQEPQRKYHTLQHLAECLRLFERHRSLTTYPDEVEIALWFHDAIYEVRASDNEVRSAQWATDSLRSASVRHESCERVREHILATRHAVLPVGSDQALLVDIDLSILGATEARFEEYETQVRAEYLWVPDFLFRRKRREILADFLARVPIYATTAIRQELEASARINLSRSLERLR